MSPDIRTYADRPSPANIPFLDLRPAIFAFTADDNLSREACLAWIRDQNLEGLTLPAVGRAEIERVTTQSPSSS